RAGIVVNKGRGGGSVPAQAPSCLEDEAPLRCYLVTTFDRMIPAHAQRMMSGRTGFVEVEKPERHAISLKRPDGLAELIKSAAKQSEPRRSIADRPHRGFGFTASPRSARESEYARERVRSCFHTLCVVAQVSHMTRSCGCHWCR